MHPNANISFQLNETRRLVDAIATMQVSASQAFSSCAWHICGSCAVQVCGSCALHIWWLHSGVPPPVALQGLHICRKNKRAYARAYPRALMRVNV